MKIDFALEEKCSKCSGRGEFSQKPCPTCAGACVVLTPFGEEVVEVIARRFGLARGESTPR